MRSAFIAILLGMTLLSACMGAPGNATLEPATVESPAVPVSTDTSIPVLPSDTAAPTEALPNPKLPAAPYESQPYINEAAGFALDIPAGWTVSETILGPRGTQVQFLSSPELGEAPLVPAGGTRLNATIYQWDPKNDLAAFVANQKTAWESSGITILEEEPLVLEQGLPAVRFHVQAPDTDLVYLMTALGDGYLVLSGEGDLALVDQIVQRLRPISP